MKRLCYGAIALGVGLGLLAAGCGRRERAGRFVSETESTSMLEQGSITKGKTMVRGLGHRTLETTKVFRVGADGTRTLHKTITVDRFSLSAPDGTELAAEETKTVRSRDGGVLEQSKDVRMPFAASE